MTDLGTAYVQIEPSAKGISGKISNLIGGEAEAAGKSSGESLAKSLVSSLKGVIAAAGIGKIIGDAISAGADLEQQIGGVETLFAVSDRIKEMNRQILADTGMTAEEIEAAWQEPINTVLENAKNAYREAGMSQNEYMETINGFAAALNQSTGDVMRSAEVGQMAVVDMSDNANKMGTSIDAIKNAYAGFAKQNYTMLDNLKLGYGGTADEMARLINDAGLLGDTVKVTSKTVKDVPLDMIFESIHKIQEEMGITGTTAKEAATTYAGSLGMLQASWQNVLATMTLGEGLDTALSGLGESLVAFGSNAVRMLSNLLMQLPSLLAGIFTKIAPQVLPAVQNLLVQLEQAIVTGVPKMLSAGQELVTKIVDGMTTKLPEILAKGGELVNRILDGIMKEWPSIITSGSQIIMNLIIGLMKALPNIITTIGTIITNLISTIIKRLPEILSTGIKLLDQFSKGVIQNMPAIIGTISQVVAKLIQTFVSNFPQILAIGVKLLGQIITGILQTIPRLIAAIPQVIRAITSAFQFDWGSIGRNILDGVKNGILGAISGVMSAARSAAQSIYSSIAGFFRIGSPSKLMEQEIGQYIPEGIAVGIEKNNSAIQAARGMSDAIATSSFGMISAATPDSRANNLSSNIQITVNPSPGMDETQLAYRIGEILAEQSARERMVFA